MVQGLGFSHTEYIEMLLRTPLRSPYTLGPSTLTLLWRVHPIKRAELLNDGHQHRLDSVR